MNEGLDKVGGVVRCSRAGACCAMLNGRVVMVLLLLWGAWDMVDRLQRF